MKKLLSAMLSGSLLFGTLMVIAQPAQAAVTTGTFTTLATDVDSRSVESGMCADSAGNLYWVTNTSSAYYGGDRLFRWNKSTDTVTLLHLFPLDKSDGYFSHILPVYDAATNTVMGASNYGGNAWSSSGAGTLWKYDVTTSTFSVMYKLVPSTDGGGPLSITLDAARHKIYGTQVGSPGSYNGNYRMFSYDFVNNSFSQWAKPAGSGALFSAKYSATTDKIYIASVEVSGAGAGGIYVIDATTHASAPVITFTTASSVQNPQTIYIDESVSPPRLFFTTVGTYTGVNATSYLMSFNRINADGTGFTQINQLGKVGYFDRNQTSIFLVGPLVYVAETNNATLVSFFKDGGYQPDSYGSDQLPGAGYFYGGGVFNADEKAFYDITFAGVPVKFTLDSALSNPSFVQVVGSTKSFDYGADYSSATAFTVDSAHPASNGWTTEPTCGIYKATDMTTPLTGTLDAGSYVTHCDGGVLDPANTASNVVYVDGSLTINKINATLKFTGPRWIPQGGANQLGLAVSITPAACATGNVRWGADKDARATLRFGAYTPSATENVDNDTAGEYIYTAYFNQGFNIALNNPNCNPTSLATKVQIGGVEPLPSVTVAVPADQNYAYGTTPTLDLSAVSTLDSDGSAFSDWTGGAEPNCKVYTDSSYATEVIPSASTPAGDYVIHCTASLDSARYQAPEIGEDTKLTLNKATLTITADDQALVVGASVPASSFYTFSYGAFQNSDSSSDLTTEPTCNSPYSSTDVVGSTSTITCSGGLADNYNFSYNTGTLSVLDPTIYVVPDEMTLTEGDAAPQFTFKFYQDAAHTILVTPTVVTPPTCAANYTTSSSATTMEITCSGGELAGGFVMDFSASSTLTVQRGSGSGLTTVRIVPFQGGSYRLNRVLVKQLKSLALDLQGVKTIRCVGYTSGPTIKAKDKRLAQNRANVVCSYLRDRVPGLSFSKAKAITTKIHGKSIRRVLVSYAKPN